MVATIFTPFWLLWTAVGARHLQLVCWQPRHCAAPFTCCTRQLIPSNALHSAATRRAELAVSRREGGDYEVDDMVRARRDTEPAILARLALDHGQGMVSSATPLQQVSLLLGSSLNACCPHLQRSGLIFVSLFVSPNIQCGWLTADRRKPKRRVISATDLHIWRIDKTSLVTGCEEPLCRMISARRTAETSNSMMARARAKLYRLRMPRNKVKHSLVVD